MSNRIEQYVHPHNGSSGSPVGANVREDLAQSPLETQAAKTLQWIKEHPAATMGAAVLMGVVIGWIIKRK